MRPSAGEWALAGMQEMTTAGTRVPAARRAAPDPGIELPEVAVPTVLVAAASLALWLVATTLTVAVVEGRLGRGWLAVTIPALTLVTFSMFTVLHESVHHAAGRVSWVNACLGRLAMPFVAAWASFPMFTWLHIEHHRNTNEGLARDPDAWTEDAPTWQLPLRWLTLDLWYACFYLPRMRRRPAGEQLGVLATLTVVAGVIVTLVTTGHGTELVLVYLLPQRLGVGLLSWWFDWLPHHGLESTSRSDRFQATRVRVGWERVMSPLMFNQNYHLVHHIHPTIPFYRYVQAWRSTEADWLSRDVPIATAWGSSLTSQEYTAWRSLTASYDGRRSASHGVTAGPYDGVAAGRSRLHALTVEAVRPLTAEAVAVTLEVPPGLAEAFAFRAGQHVTIRVVLDGQEVRRTYSVLSPEGSGALTLGVKRVAGGALSTYLTRELRAGDTLDVGEPSGGFVLAPARGRVRTLGAVAAGSGITPVMSLLATALAADPDTTATLVYANRSPATTMLADELAALVGRSAGRLRVVHVHSAAQGAGPAGLVLAGRLTPARFAELVDGSGLRDVDEWYLCGPLALTEAVTTVLQDRGVAPQDVHRELFVAPVAARADLGPTVVPATLEVTLDGRTTSVTTTGDESLLEASLRAGLDAPYSCTGGACGTCRGLLRGGTVHLQQSWALTPSELAQGWILSCQARPTSPRVVLDLDQG